MTTPILTATPTARPPAEAPALEQFPDFPPRTDMMNTTHLHDYGNQPMLRLHLGRPDTTVVLGEVPVYWYATRRRTDVRIPDLLVALDIRRAQVITQKGFSIRDQGKPPDFVLEVASDTTSRTDETDKWLDYARFGVLEYWLFDPDWGLRYPAGLIGWRLVNGRFVPIIVHWYAPGMYCAWSAVLGLYVCWEFGRLRWYDPVKGEYLRTHDEERATRIAERNTRIAAETQRDEERNTRIAAEAEIQRLRAEIARYQADAGDEA